MSSERRLFRTEALAHRAQREPIDGLLRVTAPHEWVFVLGLAIALLALAAWAFFGSVERTIEADCALAGQGAGFAGGNFRNLEAVALVPPRDARRLGTGMKAYVQTPAWNGTGAQLRNGEVRDVSADPVAPPSWLTTPGIAAPEHGHLVHLALAGGLTALPADGSPCSLRIVLGRDAPIRVLFPTLAARGDW